MRNSVFNRGRLRLRLLNRDRLPNAIVGCMLSGCNTGTRKRSEVMIASLKMHRDEVLVQADEASVASSSLLYT
jgi:hypothetical protein